MGAPGPGLLRIPEDLSVVGFDDLPVARWMGTPLTTVRQPLTEMAEAADELLLDLGRDEGTPARDPSGTVAQPRGPQQHGGTPVLTPSRLAPRRAGKLLEENLATVSRRAAPDRRKG